MKSAEGGRGGAYKKTVLFVKSGMDVVDDG